MGQTKMDTGNLNRAKMYQLILFPFNNGATNVYYILTLNFIAYYANGVLGLAMMFATTMVTVMRLFDAVTDPIIGMLIDKTQTKFGKFRPFMVLGNGIMALSAVLLYFGTRLVADDMRWLKYTLFVLFYALYVIGYTFQTACTRSGQTCLTNDPRQRPLFTVFNTIASLLGMGLVQFLAPILEGRLGGYNSAGFFDFMIPLAIIVSAVLTLLSVIGIWEKDRPEFFGVGGTQEKVKVKEYIAILKANKELQRLMIAGAGTKLAFSIATNMTVLCMLYGAMMGNYQGLYLPMMIIGYVFSAPFFLLTVKTSQKYGQKASLVRYTTIALVMYVGVLVLLAFWQPGNAATILSLKEINIYTVLFILFFGVGYGAYYATADMPIPMVADCSDYETYCSGKYIPGIMGTLFSLVDKLVSALGSTIVGFALAMIGISTLPDSTTPYAPGMKGVVIALFCIIPMLAWLATLLSMKKYSLTGERMKEIQAVNHVRREAIAKGMPVSEALNKWKTIADLSEDL
ncbi:MAG: MFS transporter [Lachnospiraceae bacterium]|nr:MFS transporter [Lachnospiraceae bacterium]